MLMDKLPLKESITPIAVDMHGFNRVKHGITCLSFVILITWDWLTAQKNDGGVPEQGNTTHSRHLNIISYYNYPVNPEQKFILQSERDVSLSFFVFQKGNTMGKIFDAIDKQIIKPRVDASESGGFAKTKENLESFYSQGFPIQYMRTGALGESPESSGVSGGNGNYSYEIHLNDPEYSTGTFSGHTVLEQAQHNGAGILGKPFTWVESLKDIKEELKKNFT